MYIRFVVQKMIRALLTLWLLLTFVFFALRVTGDPAMNILGPEAPPEALASFRRVWGLDRPLWEQYTRYLRNLAQGDFGQSYRDGREVVGIVAERIPKSLQLTLIAFFCSLLLSVPAGILAALYRNTPAERGITMLAVLGYAMPNFFLGILLILLFAMTLRLLPSSGSDSWRHFILPVVTMTLSEAAILTRYIRSAMLEVISQPYIRTAQAKGIQWLQIIRRHALPNIAIPIVTISGLRFVSYVAGATITENVFAWPGLGRLTVNAVANRDIAVVQLIILLVGATTIGVNLAVDLLYGWLDPRIRTGQTI